MITIIAAIAKNGALGKNNQLIWHLPADLQRFKKVTLNHHIIMGRKTYESLGKPLPKRINIVVSRDPNYIAEGCTVVNSLEAALEAAKEDPNPYILGGAEIYKQALQFANVLDLTFVHENFEADAFFPEINPTIWQEVSREDHGADEKNKYDYSFVRFERKQLS